MPWVPTVRTVANGDAVAAATDNGPIADLVTRTDFLYAQLQAATAGAQIVLSNQVVEAGLVEGDVVYLDSSTNVFRPALVGLDGQSLLPDESTYWQGVLLSVSGTVGSVLMVGSMTQDPADWNAVFDTGVFATGTVYLSAVTAGKLTTSPTSTAVVIGQMRASGELLVRATSPNSFLDHVHYQRELLGQPAGTVVDPAFNVAQTISAPNSAVRGWLPANATYFPGYVSGVQIPTGAVFGYNIQHADESALREVFPFLPNSSAEFSQNGVILSDDLVVVNAYGIWWMDDAYGQAPWPTDYAASTTAADIRLWTTRIVASQTTTELLLTILLNALAAGAIDQIAVRGLISGTPLDLGISGTEGDNTAGYRGLVTLSNLGVTSLLPGRGLAATATAGDGTTGYKGSVQLQSAIELPAQHLWTEYLAGGDKLALLTTNGVSSGSVISARGHRLGAAATDFIDWIITAGNDLVAGTDYQVQLVFKFGVNTASGAPVVRNVDVQTYRLQTGQPVSTTVAVRTDQLPVTQGLPGQLQSQVLGPFANLILRANEQLLVRVLNSAVSPVNVDTYRQVSLSYRLVAV